MMPLNVPLVAVVGAAACSEQQAALAEEVGRLLAAVGVGVVCGGRSGVMEAVCRGAVEAGGLTVGLLPGETTGEANPWVKVAIATGLGEARNVLVARAGLGMIAIGGEYGTLSEIALALKWDKPVAGVQSWDLPRLYAAASAQDAVEYVLRAVAWTGQKAS